MARPTTPALRVLFEEARHVLEVQTDAIDAFDEKASTLLRFNVLLLGVVVTGLGQTSSPSRVDEGRSFCILERQHL